MATALRPSGAKKKGGGSLPLVPLRSTSGYSPSPLRGEEGMRRFASVNCAPWQSAVASADLSFRPEGTLECSHG